VVELNSHSYESIQSNDPTGRVKNPDFVNQVEAICKSDDHLIVVRTL
jgi:hypothetical protein